MDQLGKREESQQGLVQAMWQCWWSRSFGNVAGIKPRPLVESLDPPWSSDPNSGSKYWLGGCQWVGSHFK